MLGSPRNFGMLSKALWEIWSCPRSAIQHLQLYCGCLISGLHNLCEVQIFCPVRLKVGVSIIASHTTQGKKSTLRGRGQKTQPCTLTLLHPYYLFSFQPPPKLRGSIMSLDRRHVDTEYMWFWSFFLLSKTFYHTLTSLTFGISQDSPKKQKKWVVCECVCVYKDLFKELARTIVKVWRVHNLMVEPSRLTTQERVTVQDQRQSSMESGRTDVAEEVWSSLLGNGQPFTPFRPSIDWMRLTHSMEDNLFYFKSIEFSVNLI